MEDGRKKRVPFEVIDLTQKLSNKTASWDGTCGFSHKILVKYEECTSQTKFLVQGIEMQAGIGTHMDAPSHCIEGGKNIDEIELNQLISPCCVINVSKLVKNANFKISAENILENEEKFGKIEEGDFVIFHTGWSSKWEEAEEYRNNLVFPSVSKEAALLLLQRKVSGIGIDTLSPDIPFSPVDNNINNDNINNNNNNNDNEKQEIKRKEEVEEGRGEEDEEYVVHRMILGGGGYIVENIANGDKIPERGSFSFALPIKTVGGTEAPIRLVALLYPSSS